MPSDKVEIRVKRLNNGAGLPLPVYASTGAAGMDICAAEAITLKPGKRAAVPTGFAFAPSPEEADRLLVSTRRHPRCRDLDIRAHSGLNRGAIISTHTAADAPAR